MILSMTLKKDIAAKQYNTTLKLIQTCANVYERVYYIAAIHNMNIL